MKPNQVDIKKLVDRLNQKWQGPKECPVCKSNDWTIGGSVFEFREFHDGDFVTAGPIFPAVAIVCNVCGHTLFFNALKIGVMEAPEHGSRKERIKTNA